MTQFWQTVVSIILAHPYLYMLIGLIIGGESVLLPAIYLAILGRLELSFVLGLSIFATIISDSFWYLLGRHASYEKLLKFVGELRIWAERLSALFVQKSFMVIVLSKFVYGTRTAVQILSGVHRVPFRKYILADITGILALDAIFVALSFFARASSLTIEDFSRQATVALAILGVIAILFHLGAKKFIIRKWFQ